MFNMPQIMGIVNVTPDSFSDGGTSATCDAALAKGFRLLDDGAAILDIGGESTRPGAECVPVDEEIRRVVPVIAGLKKTRPGCIVSVDTRKGAVAAAALAAGCDIVNDVSGLTYDGDALLAATVEAEAKLILGHTRGNPDEMRRPENCRYDDVVAEVADFLRRTAARAVAAGMAYERLIFDPCLGFAKDCEQDLALLRRMEELNALGPVLIGHSRKSFLGRIAGEPDPKQREAATVAVSIYAAAHGAALLRVHDVRATRQALTVWQALTQEQRQNR